MPDIAAIIAAGAQNPWLLLPAATLLGALHALEPGHSKSLMAAFIVAVRGTARQAVLLGAAAAAGHTIVVWALAVIGFTAGDKLIAERAEPWLLLVSGILVVALALRLLWPSKRGNPHDHHHHHDHDESRDAAACHAGREVSNAEIAWFGFTGGLLPCPAAVAVLLIALQLKQLSLGFIMVAAFSLGLAATLVAVGVVAAWGAGRFSQAASTNRRLRHLPILSGLIVLAVGLSVIARALSHLAVA